MLKNINAQLKRIKRISKSNPKRALILFPLIVLGLVLTVSVALQPQRLLQFASEDAPPFFGCIHLGIADPTNCGTRMGAAGDVTLKLYGRPFNPEKQQVYYGDRLAGSLKYTNVGNLILKMRSLGLGGTPANSTTGGFQMNPYKSNITLQPKEVASIDNASHLFTSADGKGDFTIGPKIVDEHGTDFPTAQGTKIHLNATCTALRNKELTTTDKNNLKSFCSSNPKSTLCVSKEYCQVIKGGDCSQGDVAQEEPNVQCDQYVYMPKPEQDMLEQFCKVYPDSDACENFCGRTIGSELCPKKYLFIDTYTGKAIRVNTPRSVYVRDPDNYQVSYGADYPVGAKKYTAPSSQSTLAVAQGPKAVAGARTGPSQGRLLADAAVQYTCKTDSDCNDPTKFSCQAGSCRLRPAASAPAPAAPPANLCGPLDLNKYPGYVYKPCSKTAGTPVIPKPAGSATNALPGGSSNTSTCAGLGLQQGCKGSVGASLPGGTQPANLAPPPPAHCGEPGADINNCLPPGVNSLADLKTPGGAGYDATAGIANGTVANGFLPCDVAENDPALNPHTPQHPNGLSHPPSCPGAAATTVAAGDTTKPKTCSDKINNSKNESGCLYLCKDHNLQDKWGWCNSGAKAVMGQEGYNAKCTSGLSDTNKTDDPIGVEQAACCAKSNIPTKNGCCGSVCGVWKMDVTGIDANGNVHAKNLRGKNNEICANPDNVSVADPEKVVTDNSCRLAKDGKKVITPADLTDTAANGYSVCDQRSGRTQDEINNDPACNALSVIDSPEKIKQLQDCASKPDDATCKDLLAKAHALCGDSFNASGTTAQEICPKAEAHGTIAAGQDSGCKSIKHNLNSPDEKEIDQAIACCETKCADKACHVSTKVGGAVWCGKANSSFFNGETDLNKSGNYDKNTQYLDISNAKLFPAAHDNVTVKNDFDCTNNGKISNTKLFFNASANDNRCMSTDPNANADHSCNYNQFWNPYNGECEQYCADKNQHPDSNGICVK